MKIDLLYFDGCPSWQQGLNNLKTALELENLKPQIRLVKISNEAEATQYHFLGSPSFQINGEDLWPEERQTYHLCCRVYLTPAGMRGTPTVDMIRAKICALHSD